MSYQTTINSLRTEIQSLQNLITQLISSQNHHQKLTSKIKSWYDPTILAVNLNITSRLSSLEFDTLNSEHENIVITNQLTEILLDRIIYFISLKYQVGNFSGPTALFLKIYENYLGSKDGAAVAAASAVPAADPAPPPKPQTTPPKSSSKKIRTQKVRFEDEDSGLKLLNDLTVSPSKSPVPVAVEAKACQTNFVSPALKLNTVKEIVVKLRAFEESFELNLG